MDWESFLVFVVTFFACYSSITLVLLQFNVLVASKWHLRIIWHFVVDHTVFCGESFAVLLLTLLFTNLQWSGKYISSVFYSTNTYLHKFSLMLQHRGNKSSSSNIDICTLCFDWRNRQMFTRRLRDAKCDLLRVFNDVLLSLCLPMRTSKVVVSREKKWRGKRSPILLFWRWKVGFSSRQGFTTAVSISARKKCLYVAVFGCHGSAVLARWWFCCFWGQCWLWFWGCPMLFGPTGCSLF